MRSFEHFQFDNKAMAIKQTILSVKEYRYSFDLERLYGYGCSTETIDKITEKEILSAKYKFCEEILKYVEVTQDEYYPYRYEVRLNLPLIHDNEIKRLIKESDRYRQRYYEYERKNNELIYIIKKCKKWYLKIFDCVLYEQINTVK